MSWLDPVEMSVAEITMMGKAIAYADAATVLKDRHRLCGPQRCLGGRI